MEIYMGCYNFDNFKEKDLYTWDEIINKIEEMETKIIELEKEKEKREQDIEHNYKRINYYQQVEIYDNDFI